MVNVPLNPGTAAEPALLLVLCERRYPEGAWLPPSLAGAAAASSSSASSSASSGQGQGRLGVLAVAFSAGSVAVFSVPHPPTAGPPVYVRSVGCRSAQPIWLHPHCRACSIVRRLSDLPNLQLSLTRASATTVRGSGSSHPSYVVPVVLFSSRVCSSCCLVHSCTGRRTCRRSVCLSDSPKVSVLCDMLTLEPC